MGVERRAWDVKGLSLSGPRPPADWPQLDPAEEWTVVLVTGSRHWASYPVIADALGTLDPPRTILIHGACSGADLIAAEVAWDYGIPAIPMPYVSDMGNGGGPYRNEREVRIVSALVEVGWNCQVFAFHDALRTGSAGTLDTVRRALAAGHPVDVWTTLEVRIHHLTRVDQIPELPA